MQPIFLFGCPSSSPLQTSHPADEILKLTAHTCELFPEGSQVVRATTTDRLRRLEVVGRLGEPPGKELGVRVADPLACLPAIDEAALVVELFIGRSRSGELTG